MDSISANLRYWLVEHPLVSEFEWKENETWGASPQFLLTIVLTYLSLTLILSLALLSPKSTAKPPSTSTPLRLISTLHNLILVLLSLLMAVGCTLSTISQMPNLRWIFCFPPNQTPPRGPVFFWAYVFYFSKILEFVDTLLIILSKDTRRLSFLHVYHHAVVLVMCYLWLHTVQSLVSVALVTNCAVHTLMYAYYMMCAIGKRPRWKRIVTDCQIVQFVFSFGVSGVMLWFHFSGGGGCSGIWGWIFNAVFNASLLGLFTSFHTKNYAGKKKD
uniref:very-long-chain 3-oxoacyl-CoA synthase n=1 Tax=Eranthis hyemalis TaxID=37492 RepID=A0A346RAC1_ERYHA|nr:fatty acid elongase [Eranthis hyemalis]